MKKDMVNMTFELKKLWVAAVAGCLVAAAWGEALNARSYVQKDLFACYDGIENAGLGRHDDAAWTWVDLTGNGNDGVLDPRLVWGAEGWSNAVDCRPVALPIAVSRALAGAQAFTVEFVCRPASQRARGCFFSQFNGQAPSGTFAIEHNSSMNRRCGGLRFYQQGEKPTGINEYSENAYALAEEEVTLAVVVGAKQRKMFKNGLLCDTAASKALSAIPATIPCVVGGEPCRTNMAFRGEFHAFRLYARALTDAELMVNAAVDAVRYRHLPPAEVRLPEGASFDAQTNIVQQADARHGNKVR